MGRKELFDTVSEMVARVKKLVSLEAIRSASQYYIPAMIVVVAVGISIFYANHQNHQIHLKNLRDGVTEKLGAIQARLDAELRQTPGVTPAPAR